MYSNLLYETVLLGVGVLVGENDGVEDGVGDDDDVNVLE